MQETLRLLIDEKNKVHNDYLLNSQNVVNMEQEIEEINKQKKILGQKEKELDRAIELIKEELDANANGENRRAEEKHAEATVERSETPKSGFADNGRQEEEGIAGKEPEVPDDTIRKSGEQTPEAKTQQTNEEGRDSGTVDKKQNDGKKGNLFMDGSNRKKSV